jgi:hypothetical protein
LDHVKVIDNGDSETGAESSVEVLFTPTIPHCSMATLIGLSLRVKLLRSLPQRFKVLVAIAPGTHQSEDAGRHYLCISFFPSFLYVYIIRSVIPSS